MSQNTARDRVWNLVVEELFYPDRRDPAVTREFVAEEADVSEKTARETLKSMDFLATKTSPGLGYKQYYIENREKINQIP